MGCVTLNEPDRKFTVIQAKAPSSFPSMIVIGAAWNAEDRMVFLTDAMIASDAFLFDKLFEEQTDA